MEQRAEQPLAADASIASFSTNSLKAQIEWLRSTQLKRGVVLLLIIYG
jgi:hypothetical protein